VCSRARAVNLPSDVAVDDKTLAKNGDVNDVEHVGSDACVEIGAAVHDFRVPIAVFIRQPRARSMA
jgi:hypothetical protein